MASPFVKVPARIHELHSLYFIHVSQPIPCVPWLARYSHLRYQTIPSLFWVSIVLSLLTRRNRSEAWESYEHVL